MAQSSARLKGSVNTNVTVRPNFINIGPGRCASSWLLEVLESHPQISMARIKETEYFNTNFDKGAAWYESLFPASNNPAIGEISNCYYTEPTVAQRIKEYDPGMRIMINVRDPFSLLKSFHGFGVRRGLDLGHLPDDVDFPVGKIMGSGFELREKKGKLNAGDTATLLESVLLSQHLKPFFENFPADQIYVFVFERLKTDSDQILKEIYEFLGVDSSHVPKVADEVVNAAITPKSKTLARAATSFAFFLRRIGAYGLLDNLKKSRLVKKVFYSSASKSGSKSVNPRQVLGDEVSSQINDDMKKMIDLYPPLQKWWGPLLNDTTGN